MFESIEALDKNKHLDLKFNQISGFDFAANLNLVPLGHSEVVAASHYYPIVFPTEGAPVPQALLSFKKGENRFVDKDGKWTAPYVPAFIRKYPFVLGKSEKEGNYVVCIDRNAPHFSKEQGDPLYTANGEPTDFLNRVVEFLTKNAQEMQETERLFRLFAEKELLKDKQLTMGQGERKSTVGGFKAVDAASLKELDNETLGDWVKKGIIGLVYAHLHSVDNVRTLAGPKEG